MTRTCFLLFGPPGSGKSTFANYTISKNASENYAILSIRDVCRKEMFRESALGQHIKACYSKKQSLPVALFHEVVANQLNELVTSRRSIVIDGPNPTEEELNFLAEKLQQHDCFFKITAIFFNVDAPTCEQRLLTRHICSKCSAIFNEQTKKPRHVGHCDKCNALLNDRFQDGVGPAKNRLQHYPKREPVQEIARKHFAFQEIDASKTLTEIERQYQSILAQDDEKEARH